MKKIILSAGVLATVLATQSVKAQQGIGTNNPDASSVLELKSSKRGLLIPRINIGDLNAASPVNSPAVSLLVYNTNASTGVGFYYWDGAKWVRFTTAQTDVTASVSGGSNKINVVSSTSGNITNYAVDVNEGNLTLNNIGGTLNTNKITAGSLNQVLVTQDNGSGTLVPTWVSASTIQAAIQAENGLSVVSGKVELGGALTKATTIGTTTTNTLAITGLESANTIATDDEILIVGANGIIKKATPEKLVADAINTGTVTAKTLSGGSVITVTTTGATTPTASVANSVLKDVTLGIANGAITSTHIADGTIQAVDIKSEGNNKVLVTSATGTVEWIDKSTLAPTITGQNLTPGDTSIEVVGGTGATLVAANVKVKDGGITTAKLADGAVNSAKILDGSVDTADLANGAVTAAKMTSNTSADGNSAPAAAGLVPVADGSGGVAYQSVSSAAGKTLTTDGKIVIGTTEASSLANAVLVDTALKIKAGSITATELANGAVTSAKIADNAVTTAKIANNAVTTAKIQAGTDGQILTTNSSGAVVWTTPSTAVQSAQLTSSVVNGTNTTVTSTASGNNTAYQVNVATASGTTLGVVKQAATNASVTINTAGELAVNTANVNLAGDVTGTLATTKVEKINGTAVATTSQTADGGKVLTYNATTNRWEPQTLPTANASVVVKNGISKDTNNDIILGGALDRATKITTSATNTLALEGLQAVAETNKIVVADNSTGKLRTVENHLTHNTSANLNVDAIPGYSAYVHNITVNVTLASGATGSNVQVTLPTASAQNSGQLVTVKVANTTEPLGNQAVIFTQVDGGNVGGQLPYQSWTAKSDGTKWILVGTN